MISCLDFKDPETGLTDWPRYRAAQVAAGEKCCECGCLLFGLWDSRPGPRTCGECLGLRDDTGEVTHDSRVRCPQCRTVSEPDFERDCWTEGEHSYWCENCDHTFEISTAVSYSFTSPPVIPDV